MQQEKKEAISWWILILIILSAPVFAVLQYAGIISTTIVENIVYKESFQYKEGMSQRANTLKAGLAELDMLISTGQGDPQKLNAQKSVLRVQLNAIEQ